MVIGSFQFRLMDAVKSLERSIRANRQRSQVFVVPEEYSLESIFLYELNSLDELLDFLTKPIIGFDSSKHTLELNMVEYAYSWAEEIFDDTDRVDGSTYLKGHLIPTALGTAYIAADFYRSHGQPAHYRIIGALTAAALLHDAPEDKGITFEEIEEYFSKYGLENAKLTVAFVYAATKYHMEEIEGFGLVKGTKFTVPEQWERAKENPMVGSILGSDRGNNLLTAGKLEEYRQRDLAEDTIENIAPLAAYLGFPKVARFIGELAISNPYYSGPKDISRIFDTSAVPTSSHYLPVAGD